MHSSDATGSTTLVSWDALQPGPGPFTVGCITPRLGSAQIDRPYGSAEGLVALSDAWTGTAWVGGRGGCVPGTPNGNATGQISFARSALAPRLPCTGTACLTYVPFARGAIGYAYIQRGSTDISALSTSQLFDLYFGFSAVIGSDPVRACLPPAGSDERALIEQALNVVDINADQVASAAGCDGTIPANNATALANFAAGLPAGTDVVIPFSAPNWIAQANGKGLDLSAGGRAAGVDLGAIDGVRPYTGAAPGEIPNAAYYANAHYGGDVFVAIGAVDATVPVYTSMFASSGSALCQAGAATAQTFGYLASSRPCGSMLQGPYLRPPGPPRVVTAQPTSSASIHAAWLAPTGTSPSFYRVQARNPDGSNAGAPIIVCQTCLSADITSGLTAGSRYYVTVSAINGSFAPSADSLTVTAANPPTDSWSTQLSHSQGVWYHAGGVVLHHPRVYRIFWGQNSDTSLQGPLDSLFAGLAHSAWNQILTQYHDGTDWVHDDVTLAEGPAGTWVDTATNPPTQFAVSTADLVGEAARAVAQNGWNNSPDTIFMILLPPGFGYSGVFAGVCGFHDHGTLGGVGYTVATVAHLDPAYNGGSCAAAAPTGATVDNVTTVASHEYAEAATDPIPTGPGGPTAGHGPQSAWWSSNTGEIGDPCEIDNGITAVRLYGSTGPYVQPLWDNASNSCQAAATISQPGQPSNGSPERGARVARLDGNEAQSPGQDAPLMSVMASEGAHATRSVTHIVLAANAVDAASGAGLATREAGVELIQDSSCANPDVDAEIERLTFGQYPVTVYLVGPACLANSAGLTVVSLTGNGACDTSALAASQLLADFPATRDVIVASGDASPDWGTATAVAAARGWPVLIADPGAAGGPSTGLCPRANQVLSGLGAGARVHVLGTSGGIAPALVAAIGNQTCGDCVDWQGEASSTYDLAAAAAFAYFGPGVGQVTMASTNSWSDAVGAATLGSPRGDPFLYIDSYPSTVATTWLSANAFPSTVAFAAGGIYFTPTLGVAAGALPAPTVEEPGPPGNLQGSASPGSRVSLTWTAAYPGSSPIDVYYILVFQPAGSGTVLAEFRVCGTCLSAQLDLSPYHLASGQQVAVGVSTWNQSVPYGVGVTTPPITMVG